ncbi:hypothetical protein ACROYT_G005733 [Oculina patagonica]
MQGHVLKTVKTKDFDTCQLKCYWHDDCVSINFAANGTCDLNNIDHTQKPDDLVESTDTIHFSIENPCASSPCQYNDTICQAGFTDRGYRCLCLKEGFVNERCEKVIIPVYIKSFPKPDNMAITPYGHSVIEVNGIDYCKKSRGHNIVTVYPNGSIHASVGFDTMYLQGVADMKEFIDSLPDNLIVLIAVHDSTLPNTIQQTVGAESSLDSLGAVPPVAPSMRESWLLVGYKGPQKPAWIQQRHGARNTGPLILRTEVVL